MGTAAHGDTRVSASHCLAEALRDTMPDRDVSSLFDDEHFTHLDLSRWVVDTLLTLPIDLGCALEEAGKAEEAILGMLEAGLSRERLKRTLSVVPAEALQGHRDWRGAIRNLSRRLISHQGV